MIDFDDVIDEKLKKREDITDDDKVISKIEESNGFPLSEEQKSVVREFGRPLSVVACAGAGKTSVMVSKMIYMEQVHKVKASTILGISFNKEAVDNLKKRYKELRKSMGLSTIVLPSFNTFHSLFYSLLRSEGKYRKYSFTSEGEYTYKLLKKVKQTSSDDGNKKVLEDYFNIRGKLINEGYNDVYRSVINGDISRTGISYLKDIDLQNFVLVMSTYESIKDERKELDFEDMQLLLYEEVVERENKSIIDRFRMVYDHVFIDEYQDINSVQIDIMDKLMGKEMMNNLVTVGDSDQSIYRFRGSNPDYIVNFNLNYENAHRLFLGSNYRCKSNILEQIIPSIKKNKVRVDYDMKAFNEGGEVLKIVGDDDKFVSELEKDIEKEDEETVVLVRLNMQQKILADVLIENDVDVCIKNEKSTIRNDIVYRDVMDIIRAIKYEDADIMKNNSRKIFPFIKRDVWDNIIDYDKDWIEEIVETNDYKIDDELRKNVRQLYNSTKAKNMIILAYKLLMKYYAKMTEKGYVSKKDVELVIRHMVRTSYDLSLDDYLKRERLKESRLMHNFETGHGLRIQTMHSVKGLEYDNVYLYGLDNTIIPNERRMSNMGMEEKESYIEEERRLFYVAWTRAKSRLVYHYTSEESKSMFISEIGM